MYIHTFEVKKQITKEESYKIQDALKMDKDKWKSEESGMSYWGLSHKGILIHTYLLKKKGFYSYYIIYRISAQRVIENNNFVELFNTQNYDNLKKKINKLFKDKSKYLPLIDELNLSRLDFCLNVELENQQQVKAYIKISRCAVIPEHLKQRVYYDKVSKRTKALKDDITVYINNYIEVSIYNKFMQMKKEEKKIYSDEDLNTAENILRIEIRCMKKKLKELKKKFDIKTIDDFMKNADEIGGYLYKYYLSRMFGTGEIYTFKKAKEGVALGDLKPKNVELITKFLESANESRSTNKAYEAYCKAYGKKETRYILNKLNYVNTSYVTVTSRDAKLFYGDTVPSPLDLVAECLGLEDDWRYSDGY